MEVPPRDDYETLEEWVEAVAESVDVSTELLWEVIDELKPGAKAAKGGDKAELLRQLFEYHANYMQRSIENVGQPDIDCWLDIYLDGKSKYQFLWPSHNAAMLDDGMKEQMNTIVEEEQMQIQSEDDHFITAFNTESSIDEELRIAGHILNEVYNAGFDEIERAIEVRGDEQISWTDQGKLQDTFVFS